MTPRDRPDEAAKAINKEPPRFVIPCRRGNDKSPWDFLIHREDRTHLYQAVLNRVFWDASAFNKETKRMRRLINSRTSKRILQTLFAAATGAAVWLAASAPYDLGY